MPGAPPGDTWSMTHISRATLVRRDRSSYVRRSIIIVLALAIALLAAVPAQTAPVRYQRFSGFQDVAIPDTGGTYRLRLSYLVPGSWHQLGRAHGLSRTFGPVGSCRFTIRLTGRAATGSDADATTRVARLLPGRGRLVLDAGTRGNAAWRVVRTSGKAEVTALLVRPAPSVRTQPSSGRVWLQTRIVSRADPRTECHAGGPRTVGRQSGDALATAILGGFEVTS